MADGIVNERGEENYVTIEGALDTCLDHEFCSQEQYDALMAELTLLRATKTAWDDLVANMRYVASHFHPYAVHLAYGSLAEEAVTRSRKAFVGSMVRGPAGNLEGGARV